MPSPFPGMNPYLEQDDVWQDFHQRFITELAKALGAQVRPAYIVKIEERVYVRELSSEERSFIGRADLTVGRVPRAATTPGGAVLAAPAYGRIPQSVDVERQSYLEVRGR